MGHLGLIPKDLTCKFFYPPVCEISVLAVEAIAQCLYVNDFGGTGILPRVSPIFQSTETIQGQTNKQNKQQ